MALTVTKSFCDFDTALGGVQSGQKVWVGTIDFDSSYPTGGEAIAATDFHADASAITTLQLTSEAGDSVAQFDAANSKILLYTEALAQESNASDQSSVTFHCVAFLT